MKKIYAVGHSSPTAERFLALLEQHGVGVLVGSFCGKFPAPSMSLFWRLQEMLDSYKKRKGAWAKYERGSWG